MSKITTLSNSFRCKMKYGAGDITALSDVEAIRSQPTLYVGSLDEFAKWISVKEIIDNARDEAINDFATVVRVERMGDERFSVFDNGRGIPLDLHPKLKVPAIQLVFCKLHAGGKMHNSAKSAYKKSIGVHGMGASITNSLSVNLRAIVYDGKKRKWQLFECHKGEPNKKILSDISEKDIPEFLAGKTSGTYVEFELDNSIFNCGPVLDRYVTDYLRIQSDFYPGIKFEYIDVDYNSTVFINSKTLVQKIAADNCVPEKNVLHVRTAQVECAVTFSKQNPISENMFVCGSPTPEGGAHWQGLLKAVSNAVAPFIKKEVFSPEDFAQSLSGILNIDVLTPKFRGQTKQKLESREAVGIVADALTVELTAFFKKQKGPLLDAIRHAEKLHAMTQKQKREMELVKAIAAPKGKINLPAKMVACLNAKPHERELYILEGDSAMSTAKPARDKKYQELLPIRGKILNVVKRDTGANAMVHDILIAIGYSKDDPNFDKARVGKIIILTDADSDGGHIQMLLIGLLQKYVPAAFKKGMVHVVDLPLYSYKDDKKTVYGNTIGELREQVGNIAKGIVVRMKGLGECNSDDMRKLAFDKNRRIVRVRPLDPIEKPDFMALLSGAADMRKAMLDYDPANYVPVADRLRRAAQRHRPVNHSRLWRLRPVAPPSLARVRLR